MIKISTPNKNESEEAFVSREKIIEKAKELCEKFIGKVETGRAKSRETYAECLSLLEMINANRIIRSK